MPLGDQGTILFCWSDGRPIHPETISDWFARHSIAAGLPPKGCTTSAQLRHCCAARRRTGHTILSAPGQAVSGADAQARRVLGRGG